MLINFLKTAFRNLWKNKALSSINILGLAIGATCSLLILLWVKSEKSIDAFHKNASQLYVVYERQVNDGKIDGGYYTPGPLSRELKNKIPEILYASSSRQNNDLATFEKGEKLIQEKGNFADADFFKMFSYPLIAGNPETALSTPSKIVVSRKMATDLFGSPQSAIGKTVKYENSKDYIISAVFENLPANVSERFDYLISWQSFIDDNAWAKQWDNNSPRTYIMLRKDANAALVETKIKDFLIGYNKFLSKHLQIQLGLQRFTEMYLHAEFKDGYISGGRIENVKIFIVVAIVILLIAAVNFMNLTTAGSIRRAKEIGVRKVSGADRRSLIFQFLGEALLSVFIAIAIAFLLTIIFLPVFNSFTGKHIQLPWFDQEFWFEISALGILVSFFAGLYPALYLSSFQPIKVLNGTLKLGIRALFFRKGLVVLQFLLSIILIIGSIIISRQVKFIQKKNIGFDKKDLLYIPLEGDLVAKYQLLKQQALTNPDFLQITRITSAPTQIGGNTWGVFWEGKDAESRPLFTTAEVGYDFVKTMKLPLIAGRDFSKAFAEDSANYLINESALKKIGYKNPIGKPLTLWGIKGQIIGVVKDFHFSSMREQINPLIIRLGENSDWGNALIRIEPAKTNHALATLKAICKNLNPHFQFSYQFAEDDFQSLYQGERVINNLTDYFAILGILISCLGLLGLSIFTTEQRTKEIGIRKVIGASVGNIVLMLSRDTLMLIAISAYFASPIAWLIMNKWLQNYAYRIQIGWSVYLIAFLIVVSIAFITISFQSIKVASANPLKSLRTE